MNLRPRIKLFLTLTFFVVSTGLSGCKEKPTYRIGVSQCSDDDWRAKMNDEILREMMFHDDAVVEIRSADDSNEKQIADIKYFADNKFDIIIAAPNEADALTPIIAEVYNSGIPVLLFDRSVHGDQFTAFQGADNREIGRSAAEIARNLVENGDKINILEIRGLAGSTPAEERAEGFAEIVFCHNDMEIVSSAYGNWNGPDAAVAVDSLLNKYPHINIIYAHNDRMAIAAAETAHNHGLDNIKIIGIDAAPEIGIRAVADSIIDVSFLYPTDGYGLIRKAIAILKGEPYERFTYLDANVPVDLSNAAILLRQNDEMKEETAKIVTLKSQVDEYWHKHSAQTMLLYAAIAFTLILFGLAFALLRAYWQRRQSQEKLAAQNKELEKQRDRVIALNEQLREVTQSKLMFFTNVSHDLRTPLTLISGPIEQLAEAQNLTSDQNAMARLAKKNVKVLMRLINQILDFRKYENGKLDLSLSEVDLASMLREWCDSFKIIARTRDIKFTTSIADDANLTAAIDVDKIERVMFNLISNAFKYTRPNGSISVAAARTGDMIEISVTDTGKGISAEDLSHIFERFFQVDKVHPNGSGIGLALAKSFIELHSGSLTAISEPGKGSTFTVKLPVKHIEGDVVSTGSKITAEDVNLELGEVTPTISPDDVDKTCVLVIDDNADIRAMIATILKDDYEVIPAEDGRQGLKMATKYVPDLIICDVMMPIMDGLECCRELKAEQSTCHIPVLMLTACSMDEQRVQGYECGADGYMSKPFNRDVLLARCRSLIDNRRRVKSVWHSSGQGKAIKAETEKAAAVRQADGIGPLDSEFYARFSRLVEENMSDPELSVDSLAGKLGLGRTQFYRKIKALTNYSPVELLRNIRLAKARHLITTTEKSVAEISYEVGFSTPAYFGKCYKDRYGETPTEIRDRLNGQNNS
ncbi:MAG: substrate-binding domain-containing protein [Muribaculaceae bacterium]|nr:substrate-binding domain-containing protein [Muribaculaceae bacterium]